MYGVLDLGSNSIRLMISDGVVTKEKRLIVTGLAKGLATRGMLSAQAMEDTVSAIDKLTAYAITKGATKIYLFATEAIRSASNGFEFAENVKEKLGYSIEIISGSQEAEIGFLGAYNGDGSCGIIDIGGASTELVIGDSAGIKSASSAKIGAMRLLDMGKEDRQLCDKIISEKFAVYPKNIGFDTLVGIGGTATSLSAMAQELEIYDSSKVDGSIVTLDKLEEIIAKVKPLPLSERKKIKGLMPERAEVIVCGAYILANAMRTLGKNSVVISEKDNLEGYLIKKLGNSQNCNA